MSGFGVPKSNKRSLSQISRDSPSSRTAAKERRVSQLKVAPLQISHASKSSDMSSDDADTELPDIPSSPSFAVSQPRREPTSPVYEKEEENAGLDRQDDGIAAAMSDDDVAKPDAHEVAPPEDEDDSDDEDEEDPSSGFNQAWSVMRGLCTHLSHAEVTAINRGLSLHGPPGAAPITQANALKTLFRWPVRVQNLLRASFEMEPGRIDLNLNEPDNAEDADVAVDAVDSCLPALPEPLCDAVTTEYRRLRRPDDQVNDEVLRSKLSHLVREAAVFVDAFMESLLVRNAASLQGNEQHYSSSSWSSIQGVPCANWKFVAESLDTAPGRLQKTPASAFSARLAPDTRARIKARLEAIYDEPWMRPKE